MLLTNYSASALYRIFKKGGRDHEDDRSACFSRLQAKKLSSTQTTYLQT